MHRSEPFYNQLSFASIIIMVGVKFFSLLMVIVLGFLSVANPGKLAVIQPESQTVQTIPASDPSATGQNFYPTPQSTLTAQYSVTPPVGPLIEDLILETQSSAVILPENSDPVEPMQVSSPLLGISLQELPGTMSQPFIPPPTGEDSGHHGVDFAFWSRGDQSSILGLPITAVFPGKIVSAFNEIRLPYGYLVITETPLSSIPQSILSVIKLPVLSASGGQTDKLNCPTGFSDQWNTESQSLYVLYGHLNNPPALAVGQIVNAGDQIGDVGNTGASSAPHLHLEMRIGPSNASFGSLGHYDPSTTEQERHDYCNWRVSGVFQMFDPMLVLLPQ